MESAQIPVDEFTTPSPFAVEPSASLEEVRHLMQAQGIRHVPVVEAGRPVGIISDRDVRLALSLSVVGHLTAQNIMTPDPYTVSPETPLDEVAFEMSRNKMGSAIVLDEAGQVTGIFTSTDALNALVEILRN